MKVREILGQQELIEKEQPTPLLCLAKCRIGLEYEWENTYSWRRAFDEIPSDQLPEHIRRVMDYFTTHADGSLREQGCEWVFKGPYSGTKVVNAVRAMGEMSRILRFTGSYRTSLHVHLDMQDMQFPEDPTRLGALYCIAEPFLYSFVGNQRDSCNYCVPWYNHSQHFDVYLKSVGDSNASRLVAKKQASATIFAQQFKQLKQHKYSGFNFFSLGDFGTVEFRQAPVTMQDDKILTWINLLMRMKKWVMDNHVSPEEIIVKASKLGPERFLQEVFESNYYDLVRGTRDVHSHFKLGLATLYQYAALS